LLEKKAIASEHIFWGWGGGGEGGGKDEWEKSAVRPVWRGEFSQKSAVWLLCINRWELYKWFILIYSHFDTLWSHIAREWSLFFVWKLTNVYVCFILIYSDFDTRWSHIAREWSLFFVWKLTNVYVCFISIAESCIGGLYRYIVISHRPWIVLLCVLKLTDVYKNWLDVYEFEM